jgi:glutamine synthetase
MHVHTRLQQDGKNMFVANGELTEAAHRAIAGYLALAPSLTAFGNTNPTSYLRLVPHQEAPTNICWGDRNRSALVRVPLGWTIKQNNMLRNANSLEKVNEADYSFKQTIEFRCPDGSADIYLLMAGLAVAARHGFEMENAIQYAKERYVNVNIFEEANKSLQNELDHLPTSCFESAEKLQQQRSIYEKYGVFSSGLIEGMINKLRKFDDKDLRTQIKNNPDIVMKLVNTFFHCG